MPRSGERVKPSALTCISISSEANAYKISTNVTKIKKNVTNAPLSRFRVSVNRPHEPEVKPSAQQTDTTSCTKKIKKNTMKLIELSFLFGESEKEREKPTD